MTESIYAESTQFSRQQRSLLIVSGLLLVILLGVAARLAPNPAGLGTHQQLGLPPCSIRVLWGVRCPACGMTTAWSHVTRGQLREAITANAGGTLLAVLAAVCGPWAILSGCRGRWFLWEPADWLVIAAILTLIGVTLIEWAGRLFFASGS